MSTVSQENSWKTIHYYGNHLNNNRSSYTDKVLKKRKNVYDVTKWRTKARWRMTERMLLMFMILNVLRVTHGESKLIVLNTFLGIRLNIKLSFKCKLRFYISFYNGELSSDLIYEKSNMVHKFCIGSFITVKNIIFISNCYHSC